MKINNCLLIITILLLTACSEGVPNVDDPHKILINGENITQKNFLDKYCVEKSKNETCLKVQQAMIQDLGKGTIPRF
jgi:hypothetical protein